MGPWELTVLGATPDAFPAIKRENQFNDPPPAGHQFFMVRLKAVYRGAASDEFLAGIYLKGLGPSGRTYQDFSDSCGVIPDEMPGNELFPGGAAEGNWCVMVSSSDASGMLVLFGDEYVGCQRTFFSVT